jgi:ATP-dependent phosphofructokinase / diphosphate-dependent phosphofructokinase
VVEGDIMDLPRTRVRGLAREGGTILGTSRTNPYDGPHGGPEKIAVTLERHAIDAVVAIGGEGTLAGAKELADAGLPVVGVPKTIDNDLNATDYTFGFDTAVQIATDAMDRLRTTGESHHRCMVAEVMGRHVGWIALHSGMSAGAHAVLIPEQKVPMEQVAQWVTEVHERGRSPLVVVAEGFIPEGRDEVLAGKGTEDSGRPRLGGVGEYVTEEIERLTGIETRNTTLGHIQRGGAPTGFDRVLATRFGMAVVDLVHEKQWGRMVAIRGTDMVRVDFGEALEGLKTVPQHRWDEARVLFGR